MTRPRSGVIHAAGALVWRVKDDQLQVLAVHRPKYDDWSWPKGKLDPGETIVECAVREVAEETGYQVTLGRPLPSVRYMVSGREKEVRYWAAHVAPRKSGPVRARASVTPASTGEIDRTKWLTVKQARKRITKLHDLDPLDALIAAYEADELQTTPLMIVRHARAMRRKAWDGADRDRPLTKGGTVRAGQLVPMLAAFGITDVSTSPARRCADTIAPYARAAGVRTGEIEALTEEAHAEDPESTREAFEDLLHLGRPEAVCVHRPTLGVMMDAVRAAKVRRRSTGAIPRKNPFLPAGGVLVVHRIERGKKPVVLAVESHKLRD